MTNEEVEKTIEQWKREGFSHFQIIRDHNGEIEAVYGESEDRFVYLPNFELLTGISKIATEALNKEGKK